VPGLRADIAIRDVSGIGAAGNWDPIASPVPCGPPRVRNLLVEWRRVVADGRLATLDERPVAARIRRLVLRLCGG
jgi:hypothetical protein